MKASAKVLLFLDYDGTLVPITRHPDLAKLSPDRKKSLRQLAKYPNIKIAIISGRRLSNVKKLVGISNLIYIGNHGFEIDLYGRTWIHPATKKYLPKLEKIRNSLKHNLLLRGLLIENKGSTLSVHYRLLPKDAFTVLKKINRAVQPWRKTVKITRGKKVFEIRPAVDWDKGKAVKWVIGKLKLGSYWPIYIGDDKTDETAFRVLRDMGTTIHVGPGKTMAKARVRDVQGVYLYLRGIARDES